MISVAPVLTNSGKSLIIRGMDGETITFTRFKVGDGELEGRDPAELDDLINTLITFSIDSIDTSNEGFITLRGRGRSRMAVRIRQRRRQRGRD